MLRRDILRALALGGAVVAGELWIPGKRLISIPSRMGTEQFTLRAMFTSSDANSFTWSAWGLFDVRDGTLTVYRSLPTGDTNG
jgi:hypothetical protein